MFRLAATGLLAALTVAGLSACGSLAGSAHPAVVVPVAAVAPTTAPEVPAPLTDAPAAAAQPAGSPGAAGPDMGEPAAPMQEGGPSVPGEGPGGPGNDGLPGWHSSGSSGDTGPAAPAPKVTSLRVAVKPTCAVHGTPDAPYSSPGNDVTIAWSVTGASGAALAVDQPGSYGAYGSHYPANGQMQLPFPCTPGGTTSHTYTIWPAGAHGVSKTVTVSARSDG